MDKIRFVRDIVRVTPCLSPCDVPLSLCDENPDEYNEAVRDLDNELYKIG
jgi:hypothetical protein